MLIAQYQQAVVSPREPFHSIVESGQETKSLISLGEKRKQRSVCEHVPSCNPLHSVCLCLTPPNEKKPNRRTLSSLTSRNLFQETSLDEEITVLGNPRADLLTSDPPPTQDLVPKTLDSGSNLSVFFNSDRWSYATPGKQF